jgi:hypothetical protein
LPDEVENISARQTTMLATTYGRLDEVLRSLGFSLGDQVENNKVYHHEDTGADVVFPVFPDGDEVQPRHLLGARSILDAYGIADPLDFAAKLQKAS